MTRRDSGARLEGSAEPTEPSATATGEEVPPFESIYAKYFDFVWSATRRLGVSAAGMDDVVQEIFIVVHSKLDTLRKPQSLRSWIYGIVRRTVSDHHRARRSRDASGAALALEAQHVFTETPADLVERSDRVKLLFELLQRLDWPKREVFMLAELEEMTVPEIAEALEIPLNTAYSRLRAGRLEFEEALARRAGRQEGGA